MLEYNTVFGSPEPDLFFSIATARTTLGKSGMTWLRQVIHHPGGAAVVAVVGRSAVCVEQYRPAVQAVVLEIPAGRVEPGEEAETTARRELREEAGLVAGRLDPLICLRAVPCFSDWRAQIYLATDVRWTPRPNMSGEFPTVVRWVDLDSVESLVAAGSLVDAKTIVGLLLARAHLERVFPERPIEPPQADLASPV